MAEGVWLFVVLGGPILLGAAFAWGLWRQHRRYRATPGWTPTRGLIGAGGVLVAGIVVAIIAAWWIGFFGTAPAAPPATPATTAPRVEGPVMTGSLPAWRA
jgi:hypothetical protein